MVRSESGYSIAAPELLDRSQRPMPSPPKELLTKHDAPRGGGSKVGVFAVHRPAPLSLRDFFSECANFQTCIGMHFARLMARSFRICRDEPQRFESAPHFRRWSLRRSLGLPHGLQKASKTDDLFSPARLRVVVSGQSAKKANQINGDGFGKMSRNSLGGGGPMTVRSARVEV